VTSEKSTSGNFTVPCLTISETPLALHTKNFVIIRRIRPPTGTIGSDARLSLRVTRDYPPWPSDLKACLGLVMIGQP